jgi:hypothetical protein
MLKIVGRHFQEVSNHRGIVPCLPLQALASDKANGGVDDGFGREAMQMPIFEAEDIARQVKRADLATTVREELVSPDRAFNHLIDIVGGLCLTENFGVFPVFEFA